MRGSGTAVCADRKAGQYGRLGGLTWRRWYFWGVKADLRSPEPDQRHHVQIWRSRRERQGASIGSHRVATTPPGRRGGSFGKGSRIWGRRPRGPLMEAAQRENFEHLRRLKAIF